MTKCATTSSVFTMSKSLLLTRAAPSGGLLSGGTTAFVKWSLTAERKTGSVYVMNKPIPVSINDEQLIVSNQ